MGRSRARAPTKLGAAVQAKRGASALRDVAKAIGVPDTTLSRVERGADSLSLGNALAVSKWLGWSVEQVIAAAKAPAEDQAPPADASGPSTSAEKLP